MGHRKGNESFLKHQATHTQMETDRNSIPASTKVGKHRGYHGGKELGRRMRFRTFVGVAFATVQHSL